MHEYFPKFSYNDADTKERISLVGGKCEHSHHFHMASNWHSFKVSEVFKSFFHYRYLKYHHLNYEILQNDKIRNITLQNENSLHNILLQYRIPIESLEPRLQSKHSWLQAAYLYTFFYSYLNIYAFNLKIRFSHFLFALEIKYLAIEFYSFQRISFQLE